jgi:hypothetical protein
LALTDQKEEAKMSGIPAIIGFVAFIIFTGWMILHLSRNWIGLPKKD